ncbi:MAG: hypothetical protein KGJ90_05105 [Patescibacteria group bacterium]|nr:hypothetical protein [Patescibacteria group bacterium]
MPEKEQTELPFIFIGIPTVRDWKKNFGTSMLALISHLYHLHSIGKIANFMVRCQCSSLLPLGRQIILDDAIKNGCTHILWIDDDTDFHPKAFDYMLSRDLDYVAANLIKKQFPITPTAQGVDGKIISSEGKTGIEEVAWLGLAFCLMKTKILEGMTRPHFGVTYCQESGEYVGEDTFLCEKIHDKGIKLYVDHDASNLCGHIGDFSYRYPAAIKMVKTETEEAA